MNQKTECRPSQLQIAHERRYHFYHVAPASVTLEQVCEPTYWRTVSRDLGRQPWALIEVVCDDGTWEADLRVYAVGDGYAKVRVRAKYEYAGPIGRRPKEPDGYRIEHVSGQGWRAIDPAGDVIVQNQAVRDEAIRIASAHARQKAAA
jgi:hypothetical protein